MSRIKSEKNKNAIIGLDHNLDLLKSSQHKPTGRFAELLLDNAMIQTITKPMRICKSSATLIENILISEELQETFKSGKLIDNCNDHLPCYVMIERALVSKKAPKKIIGRDMCIDRLKRKLDTTGWDLNKLDSTEKKFNIFYTEILGLIDHFLPLSERTVKNYYYETQCQENKNNTKDLWKTINQALGKISDKTSIIKYLNTGGLQLHNPKDITESLGKYFSSVGQSLCEKLRAQQRILTII